jgi:hypothetical protein
MIFGNKETFAINYRPEDPWEGGKYVFPYIHLILGGKFIGNPEESCLLGTWWSYFSPKIEYFKKMRGNYRHPAFEGLSDEEIFELISRTNVDEPIFEAKYPNLPKVEDYLWERHHFSIDETIDGHYIQVIEENNQLKFMWISNGWYEPQEEVGKLYTALVDYEDFFKTSSDFFDFLHHTYPGHLKG